MTYLNGFSSFDSHRCSWGNIGVVGIGVTITSVVVVGVVVEPIVIIVVRVVTVASVVVSIVVSSLSFGFGFGFGLRVSLTFGQTGFFQGTDSTPIRGNTITGAERTGSNSYASRGNSRDCVGSNYGCNGCNGCSRGNWNFMIIGFMIGIGIIA